MLIRSRFKLGQGKLANCNHDIGSRRFTQRREMTSPIKLGPYDSENYLFDAFNLIKSMVEEMYEGRKKAKEEDTSEKDEPIKDEGGGPSRPSSPSSSSTSEHSSHKKKAAKNSSHAHNFHLLKLDFKFKFPINDG